MVVVADDNADPYTIDLSRSSGVDAPVTTAMHGMGEWAFDDVAPSFCIFLEQLADAK